MKIINFVDYLTKKDIKMLLLLMGCKLLDEQDTKFDDIEKHSIDTMIKKPIIKINTQKEHSLLVACKPIPKDEIEKINLDFNSINKKMLPLLSFLVSGSYSLIDEIKFIRFENFFAYDTGIFDENEIADNFKNFTKVYDNFMKIKFGDFYTTQKKQYIKNLKKQIKMSSEEKID